MPDKQEPVADLVERLRNDDLLSTRHDGADRIEHLEGRLRDETAKEARIAELERREKELANMVKEADESRVRQIRRATVSEWILQNLDPENAIDDSLLRDIHQRLVEHGERYPDRAVSVLHRNVVFYTIAAAIRALHESEVPTLTAKEAEIAELRARERELADMVKRADESRAQQIRRAEAAQSEATHLRRGIQAIINGDRSDQTVERIVDQLRARLEEADNG